MNNYEHKLTLKEKRQALRRLMLKKSFRVGLFMSSLIFLIMYVVQTGTVSTKGFVISGLQSQVQSLENENRALEVKIAEYRSMASVQQRLQGMNLVAATQVEYVTPVGTTVARR